jgi:hypothetical protein
MTIPPSQSQSQLQSDNDRTSGELRALDCNLTSLCDHIQVEGFNSGSFSDVVVHAMGSTYHLHRLILSRSSYFRFVRTPFSLGFIVIWAIRLALVVNLEKMWIFVLVLLSLPLVVQFVVDVGEKCELLGFR